MRQDKNKLKATREWKRKHKVDLGAKNEDTQVVVGLVETKSEEIESDTESDTETNDLVALIESSNHKSHTAAPLLAQELLVSRFINSTVFNIDGVFANIDTLTVRELLATDGEDAFEDVALVEREWLLTPLCALKQEKVFRNANEIRELSDADIDRLRLEDAIKAARDLHRTGAGAVKDVVDVKIVVEVTAVDSGDDAERDNDFLDDLLL